VRVARAAGLCLIAAALAAVDARAQDTCAVAYESAQELRRGGELTRSRADLRLCERACPSKLADDCSAWRREVEADLASIVLDVRDADGRPAARARVTADGAPLVETISAAPVEIDPGTHTLRFEDERGARAEVRVTLAKGEKGHAVAVRFPRPAPAPPPPPPPALVPRSPAGYVLGALGLAGLGVGAVLGIKGQVQRSDLRSSCAPRCDEATQVAPIAREWWAGAGAAIAGTALLGVGVVVWAVEGRQTRAPAAVTVTAGPGGVSVAGKF
jgi:hypothetical protein